MVIDGLRFITGECRLGSIGGDIEAGWFSKKLILVFDEVETEGEVGGGMKFRA